MKLFDLDSAEAARLRQLEFPQMLRDLVNSKAYEIELCIDAKTALIIADALDLYNALTIPER
jgi:hypothetical protein